MRSTRRYGTTAENDSWVYPEGVITIDTETPGLRLHDGETPGGFEMIGERAYEPASPGSGELVGGDETAGFYGEVSPEDLMTYEALADEVGLSAGSLQNNDTSTWLKFSLDGQVLFVAKRFARAGVSWDDLDQRGVVFASQDTRVTIGDFTYRVRLIKGANSDPTEAGDDGEWNGDDIDLTHGSEWNRLMYKVHEYVPGSQEGDNWAEYTDAELEVGQGWSTVCQETKGDDTDRCVYRGRDAIHDMSGYLKSSDRRSERWRPVLELIEE